MNPTPLSPASAPRVPAGDAASLASPASAVRVLFRATGSPDRPDPRIVDLLADVFGGASVSADTLPPQSSRWTVMRSPHVFAKSKENFGRSSQTTAYRRRLAAPQSPAHARAQAVRVRTVFATLTQLFPELRWSRSRTTTGSRSGSRSRSTSA